MSRKKRGAPGIEPGTSRTLSGNHATRPSALNGTLLHFQKTFKPSIHNQLFSFAYIWQIFKAFKSLAKKRNFS